jgi:ribosomal protein S18 acetylase RimI-like enzyme
VNEQWQDLRLPVNYAFQDNEMNLTPRPFRSLHDLIPVTNFLSGRQLWQPLPAYWNTGKSRLDVYLTMFEGHASNHQLWEDEAGQIQAYTCLSPDEKTPIYATPDVRQWRVLVHPEQRTTQRLSGLIQDAEARLEARLSRESITTVAYDSSRVFPYLLQHHGYVKQQPLEVYMTRSLTDPIPLPIVPDGFMVRPFAGQHELLSRASLTNSAFGGFEGPSEWSINDVNNMIPFCQAIQAIDLIATTPDALIVSSCIAFCDPLTKLGEFDAVGTHRLYWQRGLAKALLLTGLHWMRGAGMKRAVIRTDVDNMPAQRTYHSVGYQIVDRLFLYEKQSEKAAG